MRCLLTTILLDKTTPDLSSKARAYSNRAGHRHLTYITTPDLHNNTQFYSLNRIVLGTETCSQQQGVLQYYIK